MEEILELYLKNEFSKEDNFLINKAIDNGEIETENIKEDFMSFVYKNIHNIELENIWDYTDENYDNGLTHLQNFNNLLNYLL
jgi:hypothetical protein